MRIVLLLIVFTGPLLFSCEKDNSCSPTAHPSLSGRWKWIYSSGGIAGITYTPESTGDNKILEFTGDSIYKFYQNDTLLMECRFHTVKPGYLYDADTIPMIKYDCIPISDLYWIENDRWWKTNREILVLVNMCADCYTSEFKRIK